MVCPSKNCVQSLSGARKIAAKSQAAWKLMHKRLGSLINSASLVLFKEKAWLILWMCVQLCGEHGWVRRFSGVLHPRLSFSRILIKLAFLLFAVTCVFDKVCIFFTVSLASLALCQCPEYTFSTLYEIKYCQYQYWYLILLNENFWRSVVTTINPVISLLIPKNYSFWTHLQLFSVPYNIGTHRPHCNQIFWPKMQTTTTACSVEQRFNSFDFE